MAAPLPFVALSLYNSAQPATPLKTCRAGSDAREPKVKVICISDTHNTHAEQPPLPDGDILIHSGDLTVGGTRKEMDDVLAWLASQPHPHKVFIAGNHDKCLAEEETQAHIAATYPTLTYLQESSAVVTVRGRALRIYGSPYTQDLGNWAFQYTRVLPQLYAPHRYEYEAQRVWARIEPATDILVTHGPPFAHRDLALSGLGCYGLLSTLWDMPRRPALHVFGHAHAGRGVGIARWDGAQKAYEDVRAGRAGLFGLLRLLWWTVVSFLWRGSGDATILVNCAAVGGFREEERKGAIVVEI